MKKNLLYWAILFVSMQTWSQQIQINEAAGWLESAFVKWQPLSNAQTYNVYYTGNGYTDQKIDTQLIRSYGSYYRADIPGLKAGTYTVKIKPVISGTEGTGSVTNTLTVLAQDRNGFAFDGGRVPGGYKADGTPKDNAVILYITQNTKNTISMNITGASANPCVGLQNILYGIKKGKDTRPFIIRLIGNITDMTVMEGGDIVIENSNNASSYITLEGVGTDAVVNGMGIRLKSASNIEINNLGLMNCNSTAGDNVGLQDKNDHVWVHNCDLFYGNVGSDADQIKGDGAMDNKGSTYVTFSYNHFWDSGKASLLGLSEGTTTGLYITYHHNWFDHSDSRHPRVRYYSAHIYNNYFDGVSKYGSGSTLGSSLFIEGNYYRNSKNPMVTSLQGTDIWDETNQVNNAGTMGTFSGEAGGSIKAFNNTFEASNGTNSMRFVAYGDTNPLYNISGKISSTTDFDAYVATTRGETVSSNVKSKSGGNMYNNFDTNAALYVKNLVIDQPAAAKAKVTQYAGRVSGGDLQWTFNNAVDDKSSLVITALKSALTNYNTTLVSVQGETNPPVSNQTLISTTNNNQTIVAGTAISSIVFTWGGNATDATVTGLPASGITFVKNSTAKTITISGTPTATLSYSIATVGTGTAATGSGTITVTPLSPQTLTSTTNNNQTVTSGTAISSIVFTWGGSATDATVTGLPASGISFVKNSTAKTITITGLPTATLSYSITTTGTGTVATGSGTITVTTGTSTGNQIHNFTLSGKTSSFYAITGNMNSSAGSVTYAGLTLTARLKIESSTSIKYTTASASTLTLVFDSNFTGAIKVNNTSYTASAGIVTVSLPAGVNTITKDSVANLYYISTSFNSTARKSANMEVEEPVKTAQMTLYPNPVLSELNIDSDQTIQKVEVYNLTGSLIHTQQGDNNVADMSNLANGNYLVKVYTEKGVTTKIIIKK
ncbi:T9SS type A sorting domain-containing protein [Flavobacterium piscis]|uniref:Pectate lyase n=1 Tax=Flavobacterium piscis TaxID=1114874 RepID=A0ABU1Y351_9FLAO|nr:T9SS type A sorting domain-containing protein [Flavobacterium piscis]MDR7208488.1 pectate lyase [Flavobacterium piscis]